MELSSPIKPEVPRTEFGFSLPDLEERLGSDLIRIMLPPNIDPPLIRALDIYDAQSNDGGGAGVLLCLISIEAMRTQEIRTALASASASGCVGVAIKTTPDSTTETEFIDLADAHGLSVVILAPHMNWREFDAIVTRILGENAQSLTHAPSIGDKLFAIANTIATAFAGSVAIEDHQRSILAHSSVSGQAIDELRTTGILFRRAGDAPVNERRYREVLESEGIVRFPRYRDSLPRAAIAIRAGAIPLGTIWVLDPYGDNPDSSPLPAEKSTLLEHGATLAADALMEAWQSNARASSRRETALRRMLLGAAQSGDREALDPSGESMGTVVVATVAPGTKSASRIAEARSVLTRHLALYVPDVVVSAEGNEIIALCPTTRVADLQAWLTTALGELSPDTASSLQVGLSDPHRIGTQVHYAASEAREIAALARDAGETVGTVDKLRPQLFISSFREQLAHDDRLVLPEVRDLIEDAERSAPLIETLECWLSHAGNVARTAQVLCVHEQTVRYRLRKLREHLPLETGGPDYVLTLWAQLRALRSSNSSS